MPDFRDPGHLPNLRGDHQPPDPSWLPRQRRGSTPQMIGRYPDYDVMEHADHWDEATRKVVEQRLEPPGPFKFFSEGEVPTLRAFCDTLLAQDKEPRIPVAEMVDQELAADRLAGYQYEDMPDDRLTWRKALLALDGIARETEFVTFAAMPPESQRELVGRFAKGDLTAEQLGGLNVKRAFTVLARMAISAFYSHPFAWNEIGFGGPAYPEGYMRMGGVGIREPHEAQAATEEDPVGLAKRWGE